MKNKLSSSLLALLMAFSSMTTFSSTAVFANDTFVDSSVIYSTIDNSVSTIAGETYAASGTITFTGTEGKFKDGTKPCCIGCFSPYLVAVAEDGTEHIVTVTKTDTWDGTWDVSGLSDGSYTVRITDEYDYYYAYNVTGSFTVNGGNATDIKLYIIDQPCSASGAITFIGTEGRFKDGTKPCCIGCFGEYIIVTNSNGVQQSAYFTKTDTWEGAWIVGDLDNGDYTVSISNEYEFSDYYEVKDGSFTIENNQSLGALSLFIVDVFDDTLNQNVAVNTTTNETVTNELVPNNVTSDDLPGPTVVPSTIVKLLSQLF